MLEERVVFRNGEFLPWEQANTHIMTYAFSRGSVIFEALNVLRTSSGSAVFRLNEHIDRFFRSAEFLDMEFDLSREDLHKGVLETVKRNCIDQGMVKVVGYYPQILTDIFPPDGHIAITIFTLDPG